MQPPATMSHPPPTQPLPPPHTHTLKHPSPPPEKHTPAQRRWQCQQHLFVRLFVCSEVEAQVALNHALPYTRDRQDPPLAQPPSPPLPRHACVHPPPPPHTHTHLRSVVGRVSSICSSASWFVVKFNRRWPSINSFMSWGSPLSRP